MRPEETDGMQWESRGRSDYFPVKVEWGIREVSSYIQMYHLTGVIMIL